MKTVAPSTTEVVDSISKTAFRVIKWVLAVVDTTDNKYFGSEFMALHDLTNVTYTEFAVIGDTINFTVGISISGANVEFSITNNSSNSLIASLMRFRIY